MALIFTVLVLTILCTVVTGEEKVKISEIRNGFIEIDADGDGKATLEEIVKHIETKKELPEADHEGMAQSIFEYYDKNKDGFVTLQEFLPHDEFSEDGYPNKEELGDIFKKIDADGDEKVSFDELVTHLVKQATKPGSANLEIAKQIFPNYDKNKDDFITFEEFIQPEHDEL